MSYEELSVWEESHKLALKIYKLTKDFPKDERFRLVDQICRAATSVPTNIAEGTGRHSKKEFLQFLYIARGSIEETKYLLLLAKDLDYLNKITYSDLKEKCNKVGKMLNGLISSIRTTTNNQEPRTNNQEPTTSNQQPTTNNQQPTNQLTKSTN